MSNNEVNEEEEKGLHGYYGQSSKKECSIKRALSFGV